MLSASASNVPPLMVATFMVLNDSLIKIIEISVFNNQGTAIIVFNCIQTAIEGAAIDGQLTLIHTVVNITVQDSTAGRLLSALKVPPLTVAMIPVQERLPSGHAGKGAVIDGQLTVVVVLDGVQAAVEGAAVDGQNGVFSIRILGSVIPAVLDQAGEVTGLCDGNAIVDLHGAVIHDVVVGISAAARIAISVFLATGIRAFR